MPSPKTNPVRKQWSFTVREFYKEYKSKRSNAMPFKEYKKVFEDFFELLHKKIIYDNFEFRMPHNTGITFLHKFKPGSRVMKKYINRHTFGYIYRMRWIKPSSNKWKNYKLYGFTQVSSDKSRKLGIGKRGLHDYLVNRSKGKTQNTDK